MTRAGRTAETRNKVSPRAASFNCAMRSFNADNSTSCSAHFEHPFSCLRFAMMADNLTQEPEIRQDQFEIRKRVLRRREVMKSSFMAMLLLSLGGTLAPVSLRAQPTVEWAVQFGTPEHDDACGVATDATGGIYITGSTCGSLMPPLVLVLYAAGGSVGVSEKWERLSMAIAAMLTSASTTRITILSGTRQFGSSDTQNDWGYAVATHDYGGNCSVFVAGSTMGLMADEGSNAGQQDAWLAKYDADGDRQWIRQFGGSDSDYASRVTTDANGDIFVVGWCRDIADKSVAWLAKYDPDGNQKWIKRFGTSGDTVAFGVAVDASRHVYLTGYTSEDMDPPSSSFGGHDVWLAKYDAAGNRLWLKQFGSPTTDWGIGLAVHGSDVFVTGSTDGVLESGQTNAGGDDRWIARYNADGNRRWLKQFCACLETGELT